MKPLATATALLITSFTFVSCGKKDRDIGADSSSSQASAKSHTEITDIVLSEMTSMANRMCGIKGVTSAEAFAATIPAFKAKMKDHLVAANSLPAPTEQEKAAFNAKLDAFEAKIAAIFDEMDATAPQNPDAVREIIGGRAILNDMNEMMNELVAIYATKMDRTGEGLLSVEPAPVPAE